MNFCTEYESCPSATRILLEAFQIVKGDEVGMSVATPSGCQGVELLFCHLRELVLYLVNNL